MWAQIAIMPFQIVRLVLVALLFANSSLAQDLPPIVLEGEVPPGDERHFFLPFDVPSGIVEIEVEHSDLSDVNILDWGLDDPNGFRGWGGGNSENAIVGVEAASRSYVPGPIPEGTWEVVVGKARIRETPARYQVTITLRSEATLPTQPRRPYEDPGVLVEGRRWYAGDLHVHSRQSGDASPTMDENMALAKETGLDFIVMSEHNTNSGLTYHGDIQPRYPEVLMLPGIEWTTYAGHGNAIGATEWVDHKLGTRGVTAEGSIEEFHEQGALFQINHPNTPGGDDVCIGCAWTIPVDPTIIDAVETQGGILPGISFWEELCANGSHAAALGGSDDHRGGQGSGIIYTPIGVPTTMVLADNLSTEAILQGIREGRTVVKVDGPDGPMLETELSGERVLDTVYGEEATLSVTVTGAQGLTLRVIKNGETIEEIPITSDPFEDTRSVDAPEEGEDRYRHQVNDGQKAVTIGGYVWLTAEPPPEPPGGTDGCGCGVVSERGYDTAALLLLTFMLGLAWHAIGRRALQRR